VYSPTQNTAIILGAAASNVVEERRLMEGSSTLVIGRGRVGKTGFALDLVDEEQTDQVIILAPQITNSELLEFPFIETPIMSADELADAFNAREEGEGPLVVLISGKLKGQPSIFKILRDPMFRDFCILADELAVLTSDHDDEEEFKIFIRHVGQNNQKFIGTSHRIKDDMPPVTALNVQKIYFVGPLADDDEVNKLYSVANVNKAMNRKAFGEKLLNQPEKYDWWNDKPNREAVFLIFS
jgi:hypothetical protein